MKKILIALIIASLGIFGIGFGAVKGGQERKDVTFVLFIPNVSMQKIGNEFDTSVQFGLEKRWKVVFEKKLSHQNASFLTFVATVADVPIPNPGATEKVAFGKEVPTCTKGVRPIHLGADKLGSGKVRLKVIPPAPMQAAAPAHGTVCKLAPV